MSPRRTSRRQRLSLQLLVLERRTRRLHSDMSWPIWCFIRFPSPTGITFEGTFNKPGYLDAITPLGDHSFLTSECITGQSILRAFTPEDFNTPVAELLVEGRIAFLATEDLIIYGVDLLNLCIVRISMLDGGSALPEIPLPFNRGEEVLNSMIISNGFLFIITLGDSAVFSYDIRRPQHGWHRLFALEDGVESFDAVADPLDEGTHQFVLIVDGEEVHYRTSPEDDNTLVTPIPGAEHCRFVPNSDALACVATRHSADGRSLLPRSFLISVTVVDLIRRASLLISAPFVGSGLLKFLSITTNWDVVTVATAAVSDDHFLGVATLKLQDEEVLPQQQYSSDVRPDIGI
ncbi:hypothetical protein FOZ61_002821 [Perkinsus olseni]|uniref:Uncharacterized protein n=1 Tax=Perkinsus olseni TaxID=32597 RepID=A0A7J6LS86_PEROL|nr:hypothetical protein FOZ61_002821 [Perkinsus olseni]